LKHGTGGQRTNWKVSPPTRGRGLKPLTLPAKLSIASVAPHAGAWIETV